MDSNRIAAAEAALTAARRKGDMAAITRLTKEIADLRAAQEPPRDPPAPPPPVPGPNALPVPPARQPELSAADAAAVKAHGDTMARITVLETGVAKLAGDVARLQAPQKPQP